MEDQIALVIEAIGLIGSAIFIFYALACIFVAVFLWVTENLFATEEGIDDAWRVGR